MISFRVASFEFHHVMDCEIICSDSLDSTSILENSLSAKEKIISELNTELHNIETTLSAEREQYMDEIKKLNAALIEKVYQSAIFSPSYRSFCR